MKQRARTILTVIASAFTMLAPATASAAGNGAPLHAPAPQQEETDSLMKSATRSLIESFGELSKTAGKLSEAALKLLESQEKGNTAASPDGNNLTERHTTATQPTTRPANNHVFISDGDDSHTPAATHTPSTNRVFISDTEDPRLPLTPATNITTDTAVRTAGSDTTITYSENSELGSIWDLPQSDHSGGAYIWIPDSVMQTVEAVLNGKVPSSGRNSGNFAEPNLDETTFWHGEEIPLAIPTKRLGRYDRKLYNWLIYPKGLWHIGLTANYGELDTENSELLSIMKDVDLKGKIYSIKPSVSYFLRNNMSVGIRLAFTKGDFGINSFKVDIDEDMSFNLHDIKYTSESYSAAIFMQQYFGLSRRGRFAVFNEAELSVGDGNSHFIRPFDGEVRDTRTRTRSVNLNYSPGVSIMMMKNAAFNLSFGIFGFHLKTEKQWENGEYCGSRTTSGINFRFNIFNINFGVAIII